MPAESVSIAVVGGSVLVVLWLIFGVLPAILERPFKTASPADETLEHLNHPCHHAPTVSYTAAQAQRIMQRLIECDATACHAKAAAFRVLAEAGMVKPAKDLR
ncbi:hypothetical protein OHA40_25020 [Nocardia sp. NBC_00508]|uniref:hypothetical protein n=1 Tax=Nocardia sp. NBC_00508 TaxID=2975992 RepID=UPI002E804808|nr:hypothetical protein [Nocardia sp. NBC_00508]WUD64914.1 hypothetical protein OHA40_25020 [Nocardia sp. NBC_00508]